MTRQMTKEDLLPIYTSEMVLRELHKQHPISFEAWLIVSGYGMLLPGEVPMYFRY